MHIAHNFCDLSPDQNTCVDTKEIRYILSKIRSTKQIIITKADKGSGVVVPNSNDYLAKTSEVINDNSKLKELGPVKNNDNTIKFENNLYKLFLKFENNKEIQQNGLICLKL